MRLTLLLALAIVTGPAFAQQPSDSSNSSNSDIVSLTLRLFRSSDRDIPAAVLWDEATKVLNSASLRELAALNTPEILGKLNSPDHPARREGWVNQGTVENLLKLIHIARQFCRDGLCRPWDEQGDRLPGLHRDDLDRYVRRFDPPPRGIARSLKPGEFNFQLYEYARMVRIGILNNDFYNFRVAALYFNENLADQTVVFSLFSRGKSGIPYMISAGQDLVLLALQQLRFSERDVQHLKAKPELKGLPDHFWERLRQWRFTGEVRSMPVGTIVFANEPIMQIKTDALTGQILETFVIPIVNKMTTFVTNSVALIKAADGRPVLEGGTRRGFDGLLSSLAAMLAGAYATSNTEIGRITGLPDGGTWNHASVGMFASEEEAFIAQDRLNPGLLKLTDTYSIEQGLRNAIRVSGLALKGIRLDSNLPGMDKGQTVDRVRTIATEVGFDHLDITYSDGLTKKELETLKGSPFQFALIGTDAAAPSTLNGLNFVYKLVQIGNSAFSTTTRYPVKASSGKPSIPGELQVYRMTSTDAQGQARMIGDLMALIQEPDPETSLPLLQVAMRNREITDGFIREPKDIALNIQTNLKSLPAEIDTKPYPVQLAPQLAALTAKRQKEVQTVSTLKQGVWITDFKNLSPEAVRLYSRIAALYGLERLTLVPLRSEKYHLPLPEMNARIDLARILIGHSDKIEISKPISAEDLDSLLEERGSNVLWLSDSPPLVSDLESSGPSQRHWVLLAEGVARFELNGRLFPEFKFNGSYFGRNDLGGTLESIQITPGVERASGHEVWSYYSQLRYAFVVHATDPQQTFEDTSTQPQADQLQDGALAVKGTAATREAIERVLRSAYATGHAKVSLSRDAHFQAEIDDPKWNGEFHPSGTQGAPGYLPGFPPHGMAGRSGPDGNRFVANIEAWLRDLNPLVVPSHREQVDASGRSLVRVPFEINLDQSRNQNMIHIFEKNGVGAHSVFSNPRFETYLAQIDRYKILPQFHFGWCTDFCDRAAIEGSLARGYLHQYFVIDASAGVFPETTRDTLRWLDAQGVRFITTAEFEYLMSRWNSPDGITIARVLEDLTSLKIRSKTHAHVMGQVSLGRWTNTSRVPKSCEAMFEH